MPDSLKNPSRTTTPAIEDTLAAIRDYLQHLRFGSIALTVHDGKVVQLEVTEKRRLTT